LLTSEGGHFWVKYNLVNYTTADLSNIRSSPIKNDRTRHYTNEAITHVNGDNEEQFKDWIFYRLQEFKKMWEASNNQFKNFIH
jgi:hypothetical protein